MDWYCRLLPVTDLGYNVETVVNFRKWPCGNIITVHVCTLVFRTAIDASFIRVV